MLHEMRADNESCVHSHTDSPPEAVVTTMTAIVYRSVQRVSALTATAVVCCVQVPAVVADGPSACAALPCFMCACGLVASATTTRNRTVKVHTAAVVPRCGYSDH